MPPRFAWARAFFAIAVASCCAVGCYQVPAPPPPPPPTPPIAIATPVPPPAVAAPEETPDEETPAVTEAPPAPMPPPAPTFAKERIVLIAPRNPIIIEFHLSIDGQPHTAALARLVTEVMKLTDPDGDGRVSWKELC